MRCDGEGVVSIVEVADPRPADGQALVRIQASAVCGSERGHLVNGFDGNTGHEAAGVVLEPGSSAFEPGDVVGMTAITGCGTCDRCVAGRELHCRSGPRMNMGWHAELATVPGSALRALPVGIDLGVAAMLTGDPLGVPARGLRRAPADPLARVIVIGLGPVGLGHVVVRAFEGAHVVGIEPSAYRRELAKRLGAAITHAPGETVEQAPLVIECTGRPECIQQAFDLVENGGTVLQSGECHSEVGLNPSSIFIRREITYTGGWYYASEDYGAMRDMMARGLPLGDLCTHDVPAGDVQPAITDFLEGRSGKVVVRWV